MTARDADNRDDGDEGVYLEYDDGDKAYQKLNQVKPACVAAHWFIMMKDRVNVSHAWFSRQRSSVRACNMGVCLQLRLLRPLHPAGQQTTIDNGSGGGSGTSAQVAAESETVEQEQEEALVRLQPMHA